MVVTYKYVTDKATGERIEVKTAEPRRTRSNRGHYFPILPLEVMPKLTRAGPYAVPVFMAILYLWKVRKVRPVKTGRKLEQLVGLSRWKIIRAVNELERGQFITVERKPGRSLWIEPNL